MMNINKMARAAGIGSAVGAVGGIIKISSDSEPDTSSNILGGIVGGALVGAVGGAGISAGRQYLQAKKMANVTGSDIAEVVAKRASTPQAPKAQKSTQSSVINNAQDLNVAKQVSQATAGNTAPIREFDDFELESAVADIDEMMAAYDAGYSYKEAGLGDYRDHMRRLKNVYEPDTYQQLYDHPGASFNSSDVLYVSGVKDAIRHRLNNKPITNVAKPAHVNSTQNGTIEKLIDDYYGPGTSTDKYVRDKLNKNFTETKTFRKWHIDDPYSDGEIGTDLEIRQRKSNGVFEIKQHSFFVDDPEYYSEPSKWTPYKFS